MKVVILGAGGHAREVAEILRQQTTSDPSDILGFIDEDQASHGCVRDNLPVLGDWSWFQGRDLRQIHTICAVGNPAVCRRLVETARSLGLNFTRAISPLAHISPRARVGSGVTIFPHAVVNTGAEIGDHSILNLAVTVSHDTRVGPFCNLNPGVQLAGNVTVDEGCYVGMGSKVIQGCVLGARSVVGAGAVVVRDLEADVTAVGVPARVIKRRQEDEYRDRTD